MREYNKLSSEQQKVYSAAYNNYFKTHKNPNGTNANTYAIKMAKSAKAQKMINSVKEGRALAKSIVKGGSLTPKGYRTNPKTGRLEKISKRGKK